MGYRFTGQIRDTMSIEDDLLVHRYSPMITLCELTQAQPIYVHCMPVVHEVGLMS